jgi:hypothetical protein
MISWPAIIWSKKSPYGGLSERRYLDNVSAAGYRTRVFRHVAMKVKRLCFFLSHLLRMLSIIGEGIRRRRCKKKTGRRAVARVSSYKIREVLLRLEFHWTK